MSTYVQEKQRRSEIRRAVAVFKLQRGCADCGYRGHSAALNIIGTGRFESVSRMISDGKSADRVMEAVAAGEVVCANCTNIRQVEHEREARKNR